MATPKPRGWQGNDKEFKVLSNKDGHLAPFNSESESDEANDRDPSNRRTY